MKKLTLRHYQAVCRRGKITENTSIKEFFEKMCEEYEEFTQEAIKCSKDKKPSPEFAQEGIDLMATISNCLTHAGIDVEAEFIKNIEHQETRID